MSAAAIQSFLQSEGSGLATYQDYVDCSSNPSFMATYYPCSQNASAANIIYDAAQAYGVNPESIIATLQKEESLITTPNPVSSQLTFAMGYGCADSTGCNNPSNYHPGFFQQVDWGTWQLRLNIELMSGRTYFGIAPSSYACKAKPSQSPWYYDNGLYPGNAVDFSDGNNTIYSTITIADASTASLYCYTPHVYNNPSGLYGLPVYGTTGQYYSGSYNFVYYFTLWFGSTFAEPYNYSVVSSSTSDLMMEPGYQRVGQYIQIRNVGSQTWYADGNVPTGGHAVRLATRNYANSPFADPSDAAWLGTANQIKMTPATVAPGDIATFTFNLVGPSQLFTTPYTQYFVPVLDGSGFFYDKNMAWRISNRAGDYAFSSSQNFPTVLYPDQTITTTISISNAGLATWHADGSVPAGGHAVRLAVAGYQNSPLSAGADPAWLGTANQVKMSPASVAPGQVATFTFTLHGPLSGMVSHLHFIPVLDGVGFLKDINMFSDITVPPPSAGYSFVSATNPPSSMKAGSIANVSLTLKNTGSVVWSNNSSGVPNFRIMMTQPNYRSSAFYNSADPAWIAPSQIIYSGSQVGLNGTITINFTWKAPATPGTYTEHFAPVLDGYQLLPDIGMAFTVNVTP